MIKFISLFVPNFRYIIELRFLWNVKVNLTSVHASSFNLRQTPLPQALVQSGLLVPNSNAAQDLRIGKYTDTV